MAENWPRKLAPYGNFLLHSIEQTGTLTAWRDFILGVVLGLCASGEVWLGECECVVGRIGGAENLRPARTEGDEEAMRGWELRTFGANIDVVAVVMYEETISGISLDRLLP